MVAMDDKGAFLNHDLPLIQLHCLAVRISRKKTIFESGDSLRQPLRGAQLACVPASSDIYVGLSIPGPTLLPATILQRQAEPHPLLSRKVFVPTPVLAVWAGRKRSELWNRQHPW